MAFALRPYQDDLISRTSDALRRHRRVLLQAPTGAGKTALSSAMMLGSSSRGRQTLFICHRAELVLQTSKTLARVGVGHSFIAAGWPCDSSATVFVCSIDTLKARVEKLTWLDPSLAIWDECHHIGAAGWAAVMARFDRAFHVGLSATPVRLDGSGLDSYFEELGPAPSVAWLIEQGFLSTYRMYAPSSADLERVRSLVGDYRAADAEKAMTEQLTGDAIQHWRRYANGWRTVVFRTTVRHSEAVVEQFNAAGVAAAHLDGSTPKELRAETIRRFAAGELKVLSNVSLFGEGFDLSAAADTDVTVDCVILLRPT
ncbi:DEAD/DEAH box helicase [Aquincola sp. J276]|uniref:DEAD/DEAH box helicase n=1 Tax=Aquincola sp. J276 TaxID=2898432 RepID=UPI00215151D7|nr:DEAD/DEAH box helicase [Aquincola sp. J276]MCR5865679.1 DEAD/DEAH box helicase [Aquincola sp. J276]